MKVFAALLVLAVVIGICVYTARSSNPCPPGYARDGDGDDRNTCEVDRNRNGIGDDDEKLGKIKIKPTPRKTQ